MSERPDCVIDFETRSFSDLTKTGAWAYSEHATTDVICLCYGIGWQPIQTWWPGKNATDDCPEDLADHIRAGGVIEAHNAAFEISVYSNVMVKRYGWPTVRLSQWADTMSAACYYSLPAALDKLARVLGFEGKDPDGGRLITRYSKLHLKTAKQELPHEDLIRFTDYCRKDVAIEQSVSDFLGDLPEREQAVYELDKRISLRGIYLDIEGIAAAEEVVEKRAEKLTQQFVALTGVKPTQRDKVMAWFKEQGHELPNFQAETLEDLIEDEENPLPQGPVRRAIELRLKVNKASTKKLEAMARQAGSDGRARFQTRYHGALTGRWTGTGFQPLNLNRGTWENADGTDMKLDPDMIVRDIMRRDPEYLDCVYGDAMECVAKASRHWLMAEPGNKIIAGDFVSIEAVVLACLAGEEWKVEAFRQGVKIYELMADKIYGLPAGTVTKKTHPMERQDGKTGELAFGYQGALGAWLKFDSSGRHSDERIVEICKAWRSEHPAIVAFWRGLERAAIEAVRDASAPVYYRSIGFEMVDEWLSMIAPNGKRIWYWKPDIVMGMPAWHKPAEEPECADGTCGHRPVPKLRYWAMKTGQWKRVYTYGGKLAENATQMTAREILVPAMLRLERAGYPIILSVYDEVVAEVPENFGSTHEFEQIMAEREDWFADWPISVDAWEGVRYRK